MEILQEPVSNKIKKNILIFALVIALIFSILGVSLGKESRRLSVIQAVDMALEQNLDLQMAQLNLNKTRVNYRKKKADNLLQNSRYIKSKNKLNLAQAKDDYWQTKNRIINDVIQQYLQLNLSQLDIQVKKKKVELEKRKLKDIKTQVKNGNRRRLEMLEQQNEYHTAVFKLEKAKDDYEQFWLEFKSKLGVVQEKELLLQKTDQPQIWKIAKKVALQKAVENNFALKAKKWQLELAKIDLKRAKTAANSKLDIKNLKYEKRLTRLNYKKSRQELKEKVKKRYCAFQQAIKNLKLSQKYLVQVEKNYDIIQERQKAGLKTKNELLSARINLLEVKYDYQSVIKDYYLQQMKLQQALGLKLGVSFDEPVQAK